MCLLDCNARCVSDGYMVCDYVAAVDGVTKMPVALMDLLAAHQLKEALLVALWNRERNNMQGETVTISLIQAGVSSLANQVHTQHCVRCVGICVMRPLHPHHSLLPKDMPNILRVTM